jgi:hypothetical protein
MEGVKPRMCDVQKLQENKEIKQKYQRKFEHVEENWKRIEKVIMEAANETVGKEGNQRNKE